MELTGGRSGGRGAVVKKKTFLNLHERLPIDIKGPQLFSYKVQLFTNQCEYWVYVLLTFEFAANRFTTWFSLWDAGLGLIVLLHLDRYDPT